jgi:hypothetical protein
MLHCSETDAVKVTACVFGRVTTTADAMLDISMNKLMLPIRVIKRVFMSYLL